MADKKTFYLTTAIAYTSGKPHIGNTYEAVLADSIVRYKRLEGYDVRFQTGTDEHGQKIELKAEEAGVTPKQFVDDVSGHPQRGSPWQNRKLCGDCQNLALRERWHCAAMTERVRLLKLEVQLYGYNQ